MDIVQELRDDEALLIPGSTSALVEADLLYRAATEIERLQDEAGGVAMAAEQFGRIEERKACQSEIERLRLFLSEIAAMGPANDEFDADTLDSAVALAKRALCTNEQKTPEREK